MPNPRSLSAFLSSAACTTYRKIVRTNSGIPGSQLMSKVLISGAGIAGPTLAYWLKAGGFEPTLIERAPALRTGGYVIDFWGLGYDIAERMELISEVNRTGYHVREMRIVDDAGRRV